MVILLAIPNASLPKMNVIDNCWRGNSRRGIHLLQLAKCSVSFASKMTNNIGDGVARYNITYSSSWSHHDQGESMDHFERNMHVRLQRPLLTAIDGLGAGVHVTGIGCLLGYQATNVIINGLRIHRCESQPPSSVIGPDSKVIPRVGWGCDHVGHCQEAWVDHTPLHKCQNRLLDVTRGSTKVTISNNWFRNQDKVMLLRHDDGHLRDSNMKVTVIVVHNKVVNL